MKFLSRSTPMFNSFCTLFKSHLCNSVDVMNNTNIWRAHATCVTVPTDLMCPICTSAADGLRSPKTGPRRPDLPDTAVFVNVWVRLMLICVKTVAFSLAQPRYFSSPTAQHTAAAGVGSSWQSRRWVRDPIQLCDLGDTFCSNFPISSRPSTLSTQRPLKATSPFPGTWTNKTLRQFYLFFMTNISFWIPQLIIGQRMFAYLTWPVRCAICVIRHIIL